MANKNYFLLLMVAILIGGPIGCATGGSGEGEPDVMSAEVDDAVDDLADDSGGEDFSGDVADSESKANEAEENFGEGAESSEKVADSESKADTEEEDFGEEGFGEEEGDNVADTETADDTLAEENFGEDEFADENFGEDSKETMAQQDEFPMEDTNLVVEQPAPAVDVEAINYLSSQSGGSIEIRTSGDAKYTTRSTPENNQFIIEIQNSTLKESLKRPFIMKDFSGLFGAINAYQNAGSTTARIVVQLKENFEPLVRMDGRSIYILPNQASENGLKTQLAQNSMTPKVEMDGVNAYPKEKPYVPDEEKVLMARSLDEFLLGSNKFYGHKISIEFSKETDVRDILNMIAEHSGANFIMSDDVKGNLFIKLRQVPWDQALVIVLRAKNLGFIRQGNVLRISSIENLQKEAQAVASIVLSQRTVAPLMVKVMPISFADPKELVKQLTPFLTEKRGQAVSDDRTSSLIITDTADVLAKVERLVRELDIPPTQVLIEGKIVEAQEQFVKELGVDWGFSGSPLQISGGGGAGGSPINLISNLNISPGAGGVTAGATTNLGLTVGSFKALGTLNANLALAESDSLVSVVSSPRIVTMNRQKAEISQTGEVISIKSAIVAVSDGGEPVTSKDPIRTPVELKLAVTPQITSDGSVILDLEVKRQFAGPEADSDTRARPVNTREAKTKVLVKNGHTAVVGGIFQSDTTEVEAGTPGLKDVPVFGWLFRARKTEQEKNELLIFLTPRILNAKDQGVKNISVQ